MDRKPILADLKNNLHKISQIISLLENYENTGAGVELELLQKNITLLFENYVKLKMSYEKHDTVTPASVTPEHKPEPKPEIKSPPIVAEEKESPKKGFGFSFNLGDDEGKINQKIESKQEEKVKTQGDFDLGKAINEALNIALNQTSIKPKEEIKIKEKINDSDKDKTLNERFSSLKKEENLAHKHLNTPIADLAKEISLNKKFAFVNELFGGNMDNYNTAIQQLNTIGSLEYAHKYINELRATLHWDKANPGVSEFIDLVERRWEK